ncbi:glycosyltransferase family 4 protein [Nocardioides sp. GY 10113]|uniref:glycosyltransferase family 4 protein n=1 Tax=Nocardioides sp. GY 10113 TaxID=2569761 RepID=UPI0010A80F6E|nr:glycosyltransferase family 4 protein [Nocardioides sp. GY 10113]TIC87400.1 glycosyltransferase family 4 protein [Nocardioides sp. GY 10113]
MLRPIRSERTRRITFVVPSAFYAGGIARVVATQASVLAQRGYEVTVLTLVRPTDEPVFDFDPRVRIVALQDLRPPAGGTQQRRRPRRDPEADPATRRLDRQPSTLVPGAHKTITAYVDGLLREHLSALPPSTVVTTRPEFAIAASRWTDPRSLIIHQEHLSFVPRPAPLRAGLRSVARGDDGARRLDALLTLTEADLERWRAFLDDPTVRTAAIPNPNPFPIGPAAPLTSKVIVAAGRMTSQKGFERLIDAFAPLAASHPDWQLRIYGDGQQAADLAAQVAALGLTDHILLPGVTDRFEEELAASSILGMSSRWEGLGMVLLEAMSKGVPPVAFDCPEGPRQVISDGENGLLVPEGDVPALTEALRRVMDDADLRSRLGAGALASARRFETGSVMDRWVELIDEIDRERAGAGS